MSETPAKCVYVLRGQDAYLRQRARRRIVRRFTEDADPQLVVTSFDASAELSDVLDTLRTPPLLAPRRLVIIHEADRFVAAHSHPLETYLAQPAPSGSLMLVVDSWSAKTKLARLVLRIGEVIDCSSPKESELPRWISAAADARGKRIAADAASLLGAWIGNDLARLDSEIEKLALYVGARGGISADDVDAVVVATAGPARYALNDAISAGNAGEALEAMSKMLTRRGEEFLVLGLIVWQFRREQTGAWGARGRPGRAFRRGFRQLLQADLSIKTGADPLTAMQVLVTKLCV